MTGGPPSGLSIEQIVAICCSYRPVREHALKCSFLDAGVGKLLPKSFEYKNTCKFVMGVECLAGVAQVFRTVCAPEPLALDRSHTSITKCR